MASPDILDFAALLAPIREDLPTGDDLRQDPSPLSKYQALKTARSAARAAERRSMHDGDSTEADEYWRKILTLAPDIIATQSKDLDVASALVEALLRRNGFPGLRDAFKLILGLIENFWDGLYPMPDEDGMETRTAPLLGLNGVDSDGVLIAPIRKVPITEGGSQTFNYWQYNMALETQRGADEEARASKVEKLGFSLEDVEKAVSGSSVEFFVNQLDDITEAINLYKAIAHKLDELCPRDAVPPTRTIISILEECRGAINHLGKDKFPVEPAPEAATAAEQGNSELAFATAGTATAAAAGVNSRESALAKLQEIADYFRKTEPHSPISYIIERSIKWGSMPLNELIVELIPDASALIHFTQLTGVAADEKSEN
ncbi:MAG TPA: type VI secretion system protein TssA [Cellvibrio sp.]|nr:type VI secretion system protein TssA [Cellvibrio sp.]